LQIAGEKEYFLSTAFEEAYLAPTGNLRLAGFATSGARAQHATTAACAGGVRRRAWCMAVVPCCSARGRRGAVRHERLAGDGM
jgi:hypothetical protein